MDFAILGPLRVSAPGGEIPVPGAKQRALLAALLLGHRDGVVSADRLIDELWGESRPPRPPSRCRCTSRSCAGCSATASRS